MTSLALLPGVIWPGGSSAPSASQEQILILRFLSRHVAGEIVFKFGRAWGKTGNGN